MQVIIKTAVNTKKHLLLNFFFPVVLKGYKACWYWSYLREKSKKNKQKNPKNPNQTLILSLLWKISLNNHYQYPLQY